MAVGIDLGLAGVSSRLAPRTVDPRQEAIVQGRFTGPAYPFGEQVEDVLGPKADVDVVIGSIVNIITTPKGTIPYNPRLGSIVPYLLHEIKSNVDIIRIKEEIYEELTTQEPRITVVSVNVYAPLETRDMNISVAFGIVGDPNQRVYSGSVQLTRPEGG